MSLPLSSIPKPVSLYSTTLGSRIESSDTSLTLETATDDAGNAITGVVGLTCEGEVMIGTKSGVNVTGLLRGIDPQDGTSEVTALKTAHNRGAVVKITDAPFLAIVYRLLNGTEGFPNQLKYVTSGYPTPVNDYDIPTKAYVLSVAGASPVSQNRVVVSGTSGETLSAGNLVYLKAADARWWKCDADTAATVDNIVLGIAQGAGTAGVAVTSGVLVYGRDTNNSGLTDGSTYYASNTAGAISSSAGTTEVTIGQADDDGYLFFSPRYNQQLTEDQQDALAGTSGTPSATNKFITAADAIRSPIYGASAAGTDTYAITPSPALTAYAAGQGFVVLPDVANTTAATFNVSALGAKDIKRIMFGAKVALATNDMLANIPARLVYDGTDMILENPMSASQRTLTRATDFGVVARTTNTVVGSGTVTIGTAGMAIDTGTTNPSSSDARYTLGNTYYSLGGNPVFSFQMTANTLAGADNPEFYAGMGNLTVAGAGITFTGNHVGIKYKRVSGAQNIYFTVANGTTETVSSVLTTIAANDTIAFYIEYDSAVEARVWWKKNNGAWSTVTSITTNLPAAAAATDSINFSASNVSTTEQVAIGVGYASYAR